MRQRPRRAGLFACALGALAAASCAHSKWTASKTKNVTLYTDAQIEHEFMQEWLELSHAAYSAFFPRVKIDKVDAVWFKNEPGSGTRFYWPNDDPHHGWTLETLPSEGRIGREGLIVLERRVDGAGREVRDEGLAKRQMAHLFIMKAIRDAPLWLHVGLSRYLSKYRIHYVRNVWVVCFGSAGFDEPISLTENFGGRGGGRRVTVPLADLFASDWYTYDRKLRYWYEYTAYAFVHFLIHGQGGFHRSRFPVLVQALRDGKSTPEALALAYPHILPDEWDERLADHVRPNGKGALIATTPTLAQGICKRIPPADHAEQRPERLPADSEDMAVLIDDLERVDIFRRHSGWFPPEIVANEAAKRPSKRGRPGAPGTGAGGGTSDEPAPPDEGKTPTIRVPVPAPQPR